MWRWRGIGGGGMPSKSGDIVFEEEGDGWRRRRSRMCEANRARLWWHQENVIAVIIA